MKSVIVGIFLAGLYLFSCGALAMDKEKKFHEGLAYLLQVAHVVKTEWKPEYNDLSSEEQLCKIPHMIKKYEQSKASPSQDTE